MKRLFDLILVFIAASLLLIPIVVVAVLVKLTSKGPVLYWSDRVGIHNIFAMPAYAARRNAGARPPPYGRCPART